MLKELRKTKFYGGTSDDIHLPTETTFEGGRRINIFDNPGTIGASLALMIETEATAVVTDNVFWGFEASDGNMYFFGDTGKIYKRTEATSVWTNVYTDANGTIIGADEYNGYLYWATATKLSRKPFPGLSNWSDVSHDWQTLTTAVWHPMIVQSIYLLIGNKNTLATVDDTGTFTASGTADVTLGALPSGYEINTLLKFGDDVLAGGGFSLTQLVYGSTWPGFYEKGFLARWDMASSAWNSIDEVADNGVTAMITFENVAIVFAGYLGNIYAYDGSNISRIKNIIADYQQRPDESESYFVIPGGVAHYKNRVIFTGVSDNVYSLGRIKEGYPLALCPEFQIEDPQNISELCALVSTGDSFFVTHDVSYGDVPIYITGSELCAFGRIYLTVIGNPEANKTFLESAIGYHVSYPGNQGTAAISLVALESIDDPSSSFVIIGDEIYNEIDYRKYTRQYKFESRITQFWITIYPGTYNGDLVNLFVDSFYVKWNEQEKL
jgi:hypothetical protein